MCIDYSKWRGEHRYALPRFLCRTKRRPPRCPDSPRNHHVRCPAQVQSLLLSSLLTDFISSHISHNVHPLTPCSLCSLGLTLTKSQIAERVQRTLAELGLTDVARNRIGNAVQRGVSGGQKRRVTIGSALVTRPRILFLDEPTSGLDSRTSYEVMCASEYILWSFFYF